MEKRSAEQQVADEANRTRCEAKNIGRPICSGIWRKPQAPEGRTASAWSCAEGEVEMTTQTRAPRSTDYSVVPGSSEIFASVLDS